MLSKFDVVFAGFHRISDTASPHYIIIVAPATQRRRCCHPNGLVSVPCNRSKTSPGRMAANDQKFAAHKDVLAMENCSTPSIKYNQI